LPVFQIDMKLKIIKGKHPLSIHIVWLVILLSILGIYRYLPPSTCIFHRVTGYPCLSCGISRAVEALFARDFIGMLYYNPLAVLFCAGLFFFSLLKLIEFIFGFTLKLSASKKVLFFVRMSLLISVVANWLFLVVTKR